MRCVSPIAEYKFVYLYIIYKIFSEYLHATYTLQVNYLESLYKTITYMELNEICWQIPIILP